MMKFHVLVPDIGLWLFILFIVEISGFEHLWSLLFQKSEYGLDLFIYGKR